MVRRSARHRSSLTLLLALLPAIVSCSGGSDDPLETSAHPPHDVEIVQDARAAGPNAFSPPSVVISLSAQGNVTWFNADIGGVYNGGLGTIHHLESDDGTSFDSDDLPPGGTFEATFTSPGVYTYHCKVHAAMTGVVTVIP